MGELDWMVPGMQHLSNRYALWCKKNFSRSTFLTRDESQTQKKWEEGGTRSVCGGTKDALRIPGKNGRGVGLSLSGQTGHGRAGHLVLISLCGSPEKVQHSAGIILRSLLIGVVAAFREDSKLAPWQVAVKSN